MKESVNKAGRDINGVAEKLRAHMVLKVQALSGPQQASQIKSPVLGMPPFVPTDAVIPADPEHPARDESAQDKEGSFRVPVRDGSSQEPHPAFHDRFIVISHDLPKSYATKIKRPANPMLAKGLNVRLKQSLRLEGLFDDTSGNFPRRIFASGNIAGKNVGPATAFKKTDKPTQKRFPFRVRPGAGLTVKNALFGPGYLHDIP